MTDLSRVTLVKRSLYRLYKLGIVPRMERLESRRLFTGGLDAGFAAGGVFVTDIFPGSEEYAQSIMVDSTGSIYAVGPTMGGNHSFIVKLNDDGTRDASFGNNGVITETTAPDYNDYAASARLDARGRIVVFGLRDTRDDDVLYSVVRRFNPDGSRDTTFADNGELVFTFAPPGEFNRGVGDVLFDETGGMLLCSGSAYREGDANRFYLGRLTESGEFDDSFGTNGIQGLDIPLDRSFGFTMVYDPQGRIVLSGATNFIDEAGMWLSQDAVVRLTPQGTLDSTFGNGGIVAGTLQDDTSSFGRAKVDADGRIVVQAFQRTVNGTDLDNLHDQVSLVRFNEDGTLDTTFGEQGQVKFAPGKPNAAEYVSGFELLPDGDIVAGIIVNLNGSSCDIVRDFWVRRFNSDGSLDSTFGDNGTVKADFGSSLDTIGGTTLDAKGRLVVSGYTSIGDDPTTQETEGETALVIARFELGEFEAVDPIDNEPDPNAPPLGGLAVDARFSTQHHARFAAGAVIDESDDDPSSDEATELA